MTSRAHPHPKQKVGPLVITTILLGLVMLFAHTGREQASANQSDNYSYLPVVSTYKPLTSITLVPEIGGIGADTATVITHAGDARLFVATQSGMIYVIQRNAETLAQETLTPFLDLRSRVNVSFEEGLLGLAFHPNHASNGFFYLVYNQFGTGKIILARYAVTSDPNVADPNSGVILLSINKPPNPPGSTPTYSPVHNAGDIHFGPDGYLYMATGDGGPDPYLLTEVPGDPNNHGQRLDVLLGKILRLDVDSRPGNLPADCGGAEAGYSVPSGNPFANGSSAPCDEIWSYGFRNPFRFSIDRQTGDLFIGDVGEWLVEEIDYEPAGQSGQNYGWHCFEGTYDHRAAPHLAGQCSTNLNDYTFPIFEWDRTRGCSAIGGYVYRGSRDPVLAGNYLFADFCTRRIWRIDTDDVFGGAQELTVTLAAPWDAPQWTTFGQDAYGELYIGGYVHDAIYHITTP